jgi:NADP-dependent 3-hydroxy acid dehydrogenase YdfG
VSRLSGKVVAITGASSGIGQATARRAAHEAATLVLSARRTDRLESLASEIRAAGGRALAVPGDVTSAADMQTLVTRALETFGRLDVMVCNAGIGYHGPLDETPDEALRRVVDVNLMGTLYASRAALVAMRRQGRGHIIAISSIAGRRGVGGSSVYSATKAAQIGMIEALRAEFSGTDLHASVVYPVSTTTEFHEAIARDFGHTVSGRGPRQSAELVARRIVDCMVSPRAEVYPFPKAWWLAVLGVVAPARADRFIKKFGRQRTPRTPPPGPSTDG